MKKFNILLINSILAFLLSFSVAPGEGYTQGSDEKPVVRFADVGWDSVRFHNSLAGIIAERLFNFTVKELSCTSVVAHEAIVKGEIDVEMEVWTDNLTTYYQDVSAGKLTELGINYDDNTQGFYVPRYVIEGDKKRGLKALAPGLKTVGDLAKYFQLFPDNAQPGRAVIYGGIPGWEITEIMRAKVQYYALDKYFNYIEPGTDSALNAVITSAIDKGVPVVAYYWEPTWLMGQYDLVLLEDRPFGRKLWKQGGCACPSVRVTVCASNVFAEKYPEFCEFLKKYHTSSALTSEALAYMQKTGSDYRTTAMWFLEQHPEILERWLTPVQKNEFLRQLYESADDDFDFIAFPQIWSPDVNKIDMALRKFAAEYQTVLNAVSSFLVSFVVRIEYILGKIPWFVILGLMVFLGWRLQDSWRRGLVYAGLLACVGFLGLWSLMNTTLAIVLVSVFFALLVGLPLGVCMAALDEVNKLLRPVLDAMQTMPVFVYLIPALLLFGMGYAPAVIATVIYAVVPVIRMTALGIRQVDKEMVEAAYAFGSTWWQVLLKVEIPQARATIMAGINQTLMMAMSMVVTCSMIGARGLGHEVLVAVQRMEIGRGLVAGFSVVILAVLLDRLTQSSLRKGGKDNE